MDYIGFSTYAQYEWLPQRLCDKEDRAAFSQGAHDSEDGFEDCPFTHDDERFIHYMNGFEGNYTKQP